MDTLQEISKALGIRLTKAKLAQFVPIVAAFVGVSFNAFYTGKVSDTGYYLYRERFMAEKHRPDWTFTVGEPAEEFDLDYDERQEEIPGGQNQPSQRAVEPSTVYVVPLSCTSVQSTRVVLTAAWKARLVRRSTCP